MNTDTGNLSLFLGSLFIILSLIGFFLIYRIMKRNSLEVEKLDRLIEVGKWFIVSVAIVLSTSIINDGFREREQDIREMEVFDKYVTIITEAEGIEQRWLLCEYFATVTPDGRLKDSWLKYKVVLEPMYKEFIENKNRIVEIKSKENPTESDKKEIQVLQERVERFQMPMRQLKAQTLIQP